MTSKEERIVLKYSFTSVVYVEKYGIFIQMYLKYMKYPLLFLLH